MKAAPLFGGFDSVLNCLTVGVAVGISEGTGLLDGLLAGAFAFLIAAMGFHVAASWKLPPPTGLWAANDNTDPRAVRSRS